jgi:hypothetical protein
MLPYEIELRMKVLQRVIPYSDIQKILHVCSSKYNNNVIELSNAIRLGKEVLAIEDNSCSLFIWLMLEETSMESIGFKLGSSLLSKVSNETMQDYITRLEHMLMKS